ncbi:hypothetical protein GPECTOR_33g565 [Gonium pectorale]|uniref:ATP-grasp domain-containing protein n=1 Tax=Gonium pectorale TaxID=33097 RepID=A0A150GD25_GONPE|nr:hypothetical protein GPECTOR_33g565 [Gonium pectorale]|eukprot:KXZ47683.1 hypothetical protein GPECTOR_33g565 [Gonium pectorale]
MAKLRVCVLQSSVEGSTGALSDVDPPRTPEMFDTEGEYEWTNVFIKKATSAAQITELAASGAYDVYMNLCDGAWDEDRAGVDVVQALERLNLPFTGSGSASYDPTKIEMKMVEYWGVAVPGWVHIQPHVGPLGERLPNGGVEAGLRAVLAGPAGGGLRFPLIVKHPAGYSSVGMTKASKVHNEEQLREQVGELVRKFGGALVEEFIPGREFTVLVVEEPGAATDFAAADGPGPEPSTHGSAAAAGGADAALSLDPDLCAFRPVAYKPVECVFRPGEDFKHFDLKWVDLDSVQWKACEEPELEERLKEAARNAFVALRGVSYGRIDFRVDPSGKIFMLETNPNCGIMYPPHTHGSADYILVLDPERDHMSFIRTIIATALHRHELRQPKVGPAYLRRPRKEEAAAEGAPAAAQASGDGGGAGGWGLVALVPIPAGTVVQRNEQRPKVLVSRGFVRRCWPPGSRHRQWFDEYAYPVGDEVWITWPDDPAEWQPLNHSCDPNCWLVGMDMVARRDIKTDYARLGILPRGAPATDEAAIDEKGAVHIEQVFLHRFSHELANTTERSYLEDALDIVLSAPDQLRTTFSRAPNGTQLLFDGISGSAAATTAIRVAQSLGEAVRGDGAIDPKSTLASLSQLAEHVSNLSPASCHPLTRRIVIAALARLQLRLHAPGLPAELQALRSDAELARLTFRIYRQLWNRHRQGAAVKGAVEFLHISKSGGTSMCSVADRNGCVAESTTNYGNCMVRRFDDRPRWVSLAEHNKTAAPDGWRWYYRYLVRRGNRTCEYRDEYMRRKGFTFYSNEFAAHGGLEGEPEPPWASAHVCPHFLNVIMLRHPIARLVSHIRWIIKVYRTEYGRSFEPFFRGRDADYWRRFAPAAVDNYYSRLLLGEAAFYAPTDTLDATHLAAARLVLLQYDALGWRAGLATAHARVASHHRSAADLMPYDMDELVAANDVDVRLYDFGAAVHKLDGLMFASVAAAGLLPYGGYEELDPNGEDLGKRVKCGYVGRADQLLTAVGEDAKAYERVYRAEFDAISSADAPKPTATPVPAAAGSEAGAAGQG